MIARPIYMQGEGEGEDGGGTNRGTSVITRVKPKTKRPNLYRVLLLNDDYTPMEFVIHILERFSRRIAKRQPASCCTCTSTAWANAGCLHMRSQRRK